MSDTSYGNDPRGEALERVDKLVTELNAACESARRRGSGDLRKLQRARREAEAVRSILQESGQERDEPLDWRSILLVLGFLLQLLDLFQKHQ